MNRPKLVFPGETVYGLKRFFPGDRKLAEALDANNADAWDIVHKKLTELSALHHQLSTAGFPGLGN